MKRLALLVAAVAILLAVVPVAAAEEPPDAVTNGSHQGYWYPDEEGHRWRFFDPGVDQRCAWGTYPTFALQVARTFWTGPTTWKDVDHALLQGEFSYRNGTDLPLKEKEVGWFPSLVGEYKFNTTNDPGVFGKLRFKHRWTGDVPYKKMQVQGPNGGWLRGVWAAVSFNYSNQDPLWIPLSFRVSWWCAPA